MLAPYHPSPEPKNSTMMHRVEDSKRVRSSTVEATTSYCAASPKLNILRLKDSACIASAARVNQNNTRMCVFLCGP